MTWRAAWCWWMTSDGVLEAHVSPTMLLSSIGWLERLQARLWPWRRWHWWVQRQRPGMVPELLAEGAVQGRAAAIRAAEDAFATYRA